LQVIDDAGGRTNVATVSRKLKIDTNYARLLVLAIAKNDYIDYLRSGALQITAKGKAALPKKE
ncbi:MAG: hypothetical protein H8E32_14680, partial [Nitrospinae bacterium]|nr:hypothetical protein [Nitrospinota bacterium]